MLSHLEGKNMLKKKLRGKSKFLRKMNELMEIYSRNQDTAFAYRELLGLESMIRYEGEQGQCLILIKLLFYMTWEDTVRQKRF